MTVRFFDLMIPEDETEAIRRIENIANAVRLARDADQDDLPQIAKLWRLYNDNHIIQGFLEWLQYEKGVRLCVDHDDRYFGPIRETDRDLMNQFFDFDDKAHDQEIVRLVERIRAASETGAETT